MNESKKNSWSSIQLIRVENGWIEELNQLYLVKFGFEAKKKNYN